MIIGLINFLGHQILALSSLAPLFLIMGLQSFEKSKSIAIFLFTLSIGSTVLLLLQFAVATRSSPYPTTIINGTPKSSEMTGYIFSYLIPFLGINMVPLSTDSNSDLLNTVAIVLVIGFLLIAYSKSSLIYINPILALCGFQFFDVETDSGNRLLISKKDYFTPNQQINVVRLGNYYSILDITGKNDD